MIKPPWMWNLICLCRKTVWRPSLTTCNWGNSHNLMIFRHIGGIFFLGLPAAGSVCTGLMASLATFCLTVTFLLFSPSPPPTSASLKQTVYVLQYDPSRPFASLPLLMWFIGPASLFLLCLCFMTAAFCWLLRQDAQTSATHTHTRARRVSPCLMCGDICPMARYFIRPCWVCLSIAAILGTALFSEATKQLFFFMAFQEVSPPYPFFPFF